LSLSFSWVFRKGEGGRDMGKIGLGLGNRLGHESSSIRGIFYETRRFEITILME
jgi:hypothetical protein